MEGIGTLEFYAKIIDFAAFVGLLYWLWAKFGKPQLEAAADAENARIIAIEEALDRAKADAAAARTAREAANAEREVILRNAEEAAAHDLAEEVTAARAQAERIRAYSEGEVERQRYAARVRLRIEMIEEALASARGEAARRTDESLQSDLVARFVDDLARVRKDGA